ncbi:MAG TPA: STAS/SEC14 domain-containing protein [Candidatus Thermoplasmatota archaeon]|nr:STAS/SEC14 domain-containing protein [Candidatus Thermoplasmatota archaeon]
MRSMTSPSAALDVGPVHLAWEPELRLARMSFRGPRAAVDETEARVCVEALQRWAGDEPFRLLVDCTGLRDAHAGWRAVFADFFRRRGFDVRLAWFNMSPLISIMVQMFVRASAVKGRGFRTEEDARAWLELPIEARRP